MDTDRIKPGRAGRFAPGPGRLRGQHVPGGVQRGDHDGQHGHDGRDEFLEPEPERDPGVLPGSRGPHAQRERQGRFYTEALPRAGDTITSNSAASESGGVILIQFTGHGYKGQISALASDPDPRDALPGLGTKNVTTILLQPK